MSNYRLLGEWAVLFLASTLLVVLSLQNQWTQRVDAIVLDLATDWRAGPADERIVLVAIDDRSLSEIGNWPWDRARHADLVRSLSANSPRKIVFDVLFLEPGDESADRLLAEAIADAGNVLLSHTFTVRPGTADEREAVLPLSDLATSSAGLGHVAVLPDPDGVVRRFDPLVMAGGVARPHLVETTILQSGEKSLLAQGHNQPPITTMRSAGAFRSISASDVIAGRTPNDFVSDKIVIIGATGQGLGDRYSVPEYAGRIMSGAEIQANFLSAALNQELVRPANLQFVGVFLILAIAAVFVGLWKLAPAWALRVAVTMAILLLGISLSTVVFAGVWVPVAPALLSILIAYPLWGWRRLSSVSRFLEHEAERMVGVHQMADSPDQSGFDTVARQVTLVKSLIGETNARLVFFRQLISASPDPILVFDGHGVLTLMNARGEEIFGSLDESLGLTLADIVAVQQASFDPDRGELSLPDGRVFLIAQSAVGLGKNLRIHALRDITAMRQNEDQRTEMLEFLSHDMRSPQVAIIGLASTNDADTDHKDRFDRIETQARRTLKLTEDFVQISRLDYEGIKPEETDIGALLHEALDRAYPLAKRKRINLRSSLPDDPEFCDVDPSALSRAIDNLIGNAIKFSPEDSEVALSLSRDDTRAIRIDVSDQGPGLPPERQSDTFARFGAHNSQAGPSAGLGLAFVKKVVDQHGGDIEVTSQSGTGQSGTGQTGAGQTGTGTRFTLVIPCPRDSEC